MELLERLRSHVARGGSPSLGELLSEQELLRLEAAVVSTPPVAAGGISGMRRIKAVREVAGSCLTLKEAKELCDTLKDVEQALPLDWVWQGLWDQESEASVLRMSLARARAEADSLARSLDVASEKSARLERLVAGLRGRVGEASKKASEEKSALKGTIRHLLEETVGDRAILGTLEVLLDRL